MKQANTNRTFRLKMNIMIQNLLLTAFSTCKFVLFHKEHPITKAVRQFKLIDDALQDEFIGKLKECRPGQTLVLNMQDELLIYTALDITSKAYVTELGDELRQLNAREVAKSKASFTEIRDTVLKGCQFVMEGMRETLSGNEEFDDRVDILENYIII